MSTIEEKTSIIDISFVARRIKRELEIMIDSDICNIDNISISKNAYNEIQYHVNIYNNNDNRNYEFIFDSLYPFKSPKLILNYKPYSEYIRFRSNEFRQVFNKYKRHKCFCCESVLCGDNWAPPITFAHVINEVSEFHRDCKDISNIIISNVIKRKYLIVDINLIQWLYNYR